MIELPSNNFKKKLKNPPTNIVVRGISKINKKNNFFICLSMGR